MVIRRGCGSYRIVEWHIAAAVLALACSKEIELVQRPDGGVLSNAPGQTQTPSSAEDAGTGPTASTLSVGAEMSVSPSTLDLGAITEGFAARARFTITNSGQSELAPPEVSWLAGSDPAFTLIQSQCTEPLQASERCELRVQVVPPGVGPLQGTLQVSSTSAPSVTVPIAAEGLVAGDLLMVPAEGSFDDFGGVRVGQSAEETFTITNSGATATGALSFLFNRPEFAVAAPVEDECVPEVTELLSGESCDIRVVLSPTVRGPLEATATIASSEAGSTSSTLRGQGQIPGLLGVSAGELDFGGVVPGDVATRTLEIENQGDEPLSLGSVGLEPAGAEVFAIADSNCGLGVILAADETCRVQLEYRPAVEGEPSAAELLVSDVDGQQTQSVALRGVALTRGNLTVEAVVAGEEDFGEVLLGQSVFRDFRIGNPSMQPSGALTLTASSAFSVELSGEAEKCEEGSTALGNGESCTVRVRFLPQNRGLDTGALTVGSVLAGAKSLALEGRGIAPAEFSLVTGSVDSEIDFGRVTTDSTAEQTFAVRNLGDQLLPVPTPRITSSAAGQAGDFQVLSDCPQPLAFDEECSIFVSFSPRTAQPYTANLELSGEPGGVASLLLLGEGRDPGRLVVEPITGSDGDFGDVEIGEALELGFTVTNPGGVASGPLTLRTDDSQFTVVASSCAATAPVGLVDGENCLFEVTFRPNSNRLTEARLSVQSSGAGETGFALRGRGRSQAVLAATTTERDLGRTNLGDSGGFAGQFAWTVRNDGDLSTGLVNVDNSNPSDFTLSADSCSLASMEGGETCSVTVVFSPQTAGNRSGRITVSDADTNSAVSLVVSGFGVQLAAPGESCLVASDCQQGVCSAGVCCNQACNSTCQSCSTGQCRALNNEEPCGNGGGVCFGVNQCALPSGQACGNTSQCGGGLECKQCRFGGNQCTASNQCCGGCDPGYECVNGECGCPFQGNGLRQIDCGNGVCATNRANACCPGSAPLGCNCDPSDNLCKECLQNGDCPPRANSVAQCGGNRTCSYSCAPGFKQCNGNCIPNSQCCGGCSPGQECSQGACVSTGPTVACGGSTCASGSVCCATFNASFTASTYSCASSPNNCPPPPSPGPPSTAIACDQHSDCPGGQRCCYTGTSTSGEIGCQQSCTAAAVAPPGFPVGMFFANQMCASPGGGQLVVQCPAGENCEFTQTDRLPGYTFCR